MSLLHILIVLSSRKILFLKFAPGICNHDSNRTFAIIQFSFLSKIHSSVERLDIFCKGLLRCQVERVPHQHSAFVKLDIYDELYSNQEILINPSAIQFFKTACNSLLTLFTSNIQTDLCRLAHVNILQRLRCLP